MVGKKNALNFKQVIMMINAKKQYITTRDNERDAALIYDKLAIQTQGLKAKCNFSYTKSQVLDILNEKLPYFECVD